MWVQGLEPILADNMEGWNNTERITNEWEMKVEYLVDTKILHSLL